MPSLEQHSSLELVKKRLFSYVKRNTIKGCLEWHGSRDRKGYGRINLFGRPVLTHRLAYFFYRGVWPVKHVLHHCDNPSCLEEKHLFEGTNRDNIDDAVNKGKMGRYGPLPDDIVHKIFEFRRLGRTGTTISVMLRIHEGTVYNVLRRVGRYAHPKYNNY